MTAPRSEPLHHAPALTVMRGVAALIILNLHAWRWTAPPEIGEPPALHYLVSTRYIAMPLFFVLSGWVIHYNFSRYLPATGEFALRREAMNYLKFFAKRLVRLYPLYIVLFGFICYVDDRLFTPPAHWHVFWRYVTLTHSWTFLMIHDLPSFHSTFSLSWSISTELALYLSYPVLGFIALRLRDGKRVAMAMAGTLAIAVTMAELAVHYRFQFARLVLPDPDERLVNLFADWFLYCSPWMKVWDFAIGILLAQFVAVAGRGSVDRLSAPFLHLASVVLLVGLFVGLAYDDLAWSDAAISALYQSFAFTPFIALVLLTAFYREDLYANSVLLTIGTISYSLYLVHYCVAVGVWRSESWPEWVAQALLLIGCSVIAAVATYSWIEAPFVRLGRKIRLMPLPESTDRS